MKKIFNLLILMSFVLLNGIVMTPVFAATSAKYVIFIDAGSTGTRLHLYQYDTQTLNAVPDIHEIFPVIESNVALDSFVNKKDEIKQKEAINNFLSDLLDKAKKTLNSTSDYDNRNKVQVYLLGTAGMRLLADQSMASEIYKLAKETVNEKYGDIFSVLDKTPGKIQNDNFANLDGRAEALFGWLSVNYLKGMFAVDSQTQSRLFSFDKTYGSIDFGGASLEIALEVPVQTNDVESLKIAGQTYNVFIRSFQEFGKREIPKAILQFDNAEWCFPKDASLTKNDGTVTVGNFNMEGCRQVFTKLFQVHENEFNYFPSFANRQFYAHSGMYRTYAFLKADKNPNDLINNIIGICENKSITDVDDKWKKDLPVYCPDGVFLAKFLETRFLNSSQLIVTDVIKTNSGKKDENDIQINWTLGAVLNLIIK